MNIKLKKFTATFSQKMADTGVYYKSDLCWAIILLACNLKIEYNFLRSIMSTFSFKIFRIRGDQSSNLLMCTSVVVHVCCSSESQCCFFVYQEKKSKRDEI